LDGIINNGDSISAVNPSPGTAVMPQKDLPPPPPIPCPNCGESVPANRWVCPRCGAPLQQALDGQRSYTPISQSGAFKVSIPVKRAPTDGVFEPVSARRLPNPFSVLEIVAVAAVLLIAGALAWRWAALKAEERKANAALATSTAAAQRPSSASAPLLPGGMEQTRQPASTATPGASPTPFRLYLPTPKGNENLPPVTVAPLGGEGTIQVSSGEQADYSPALSRDQRRLVYTSQIDGHWQIVEAEPNTGKVVRQITSGETDYYTPLFNADATQLLVVADFSVNLDIFLISFESGQVLRQLTFNPAADFAPAWLPDYSGIVFTSTRAENAELYLMRIPEVQVSEPEVVRLTDNPAFDGYPSVSHDGTLVTFYSDRAGEFNYDIYVMAFANLIPRRLTKDSGRDASPVFSPGDAWILFESNRSGNYEIYSIRPNAEEDVSVRSLTYTEANEYMPSFSPDGLWLFYLSDFNRNMDIYRHSFP